MQLTQEEITRLSPEEPGQGATLAAAVSAGVAGVARSDARTHRTAQELGGKQWTCYWSPDFNMISRSLPATWRNLVTPNYRSGVPITAIYPLDEIKAAVAHALQGDKVLLTWGVPVAEMQPI